MTYTKGPWTVKEVENWQEHVLLVESDNESICSLYGTDIRSNIDDGARANANLIAAAPELLDTLKNVLGLHGKDSSEPIGDTTIDRIERIIARAEGSLSTAA